VDRPCQGLRSHVPASSAPARPATRRSRPTCAARCSSAISAADWLPRAPTDLAIPGLVARASRSALHSTTPSRVRLHALKAGSSSPTPEGCFQPDRPQVAARLCVVRASCVAFRPPEGGCHDVACAADPSALVRQRTSRTDAALTLSVAPPVPRRRSDTVRREPRTLSPAVRQHLGLPSPERLPSRGPPADTRRAGTCPVAATAAPTWPSRRSFRHGFCAHAVRARPTGRAALRGATGAACRLSTSAIETVREHTLGSTKLQHLRGG
jgi:hypothetical protein